MDISHAHATCVSILNRFVANLKKGQNPDSLTTPATSNGQEFQMWKAQFATSFERLQFTERRFLRWMGLYTKLIYLYDKVNSGIFDLLPKEDAALFTSIMSTLINFRDKIGPFISEKPPY